MILDRLFDYLWSAFGGAFGSQDPSKCVFRLREVLIFQKSLFINRSRAGRRALYWVCWFSELGGLSCFGCGYGCSLCHFVYVVGCLNVHFVSESGKKMA